MMTYLLGLLGSQLGTSYKMLDHILDHMQTLTKHCITMTS